MRCKFTFCVIALSTLVLSACDGSLYYKSEPFTAQIVDADTNQPIEGAIVFAHWRLYKGQWFGSSTPGAELEVLETTTNTEGRFEIKGFTKLNPSMQALRDEDPGLIVYARGYYPGFFRNTYPIRDIALLGPTRKSKLAGRALRLVPRDNDQEKMATHFSVIKSDLDDIFESCMWTKAPLFLSALLLEAKRMDAGKSATDFSFIDPDRLRKGCGKAAENLRVPK